MITSILRPDSLEPETLEHEKALDLKKLQELVGGYIEVVYVKDPAGQEHMMIVNEEGKLMELPYNHLATVIYSNPNDIIVGTALVLLDWELE